MATKKEDDLLDVIERLDAEIKAKTHSDRLMRSYSPVLARLVTLASNADEYQNNSLFRLLREANGYHSYYDADGHLHVGVQPDFRLLQKVSNKILKSIFNLDFEVVLNEQRLEDKFELYEGYILRNN